MKNNTLKRLIDEAEKYPMPVRIAASMHLEGVTSEFLRSMFTDTMYRSASDPIKLAINNALRDIETGFTKMTPRLAALAKQITLDKAECDVIREALKVYADGPWPDKFDGHGDYVTEIAKRFDP